MVLRRVSPLPLVALALAFALSTTALAGDGDADRDGVPDALEAATARVVLLDTYEPSMEPGVVHVKSSSSGAAPNDVIDLEYGAGRAGAAYYGNASREAPSVTYQLRFRELVEVQGPVGSEISGGDIVRAVSLEDLLAQAPITLSNRTTQDGERESAIAVGSAAQTFSLTLHVVSRFARIDGRLITPMEVGVDMRVRNFTAAQGNEVAVLVSVESESELRVEESSYDEQHEYAEGERAMNVSAAPDAMFLAWSSNATVDGQPRAVRTTTPNASGGAYEMYFVYGNGGSVDHNAKLGAESRAFAAIAEALANLPVLPVPQGDTVMFLLSLAALTAIVAVTALWRRRRLGR